jgi:hypothetical protein
MAEKDTKKVDEKAGTQTNTVQLTPEMTLFLSTLTSTYQTIQQNMGGGQPPATKSTQSRAFTEDAKVAVERFNFIRAGLQLKLIPYPRLDPPVPDGLKVKLTWKIIDEKVPASGFQIIRAIGQGSEDFKEITGVLPSSQTSYTDETGLTPGTTYRYKVVAFTSLGPLPSKPQDTLIKS